MIFSAPSVDTPAACILPAARISLSPSSCLYSLSVLTMASFFTPMPGLPVRRIISTPISAAFLAFASVAFLPFVIAHMPSFMPAISSSTGSRLMPTGRPVRRFKTLTVSSFSHLGSALITGFCTSKRLSSRISAPIEATNSALVISPSMGIYTPTVSHAMVRPSAEPMAYKSSCLVIERKSDAWQSRIRFTTESLLLCPP